MMSHIPATVMVVDDQPQNIKLMREFLESAGFNVVTADDGPQALRRVQHAPPDLFLLDVSMPDMDGYAVCAQLKRDEATQHIPVIFITGRDDEAAETRGFALGAADFILKPIRLAVLLARVTTHLALSEQRRNLNVMLAEVINFAPDAFIFSNADGLIVRFNAQAERLFGYRADALYGQPVELLIPAASRATHEKHRKAHVAAHVNRQVMTVAAVCLRKNGSEFLADINLSAIDTSTGLLFMVSVRDVSAREQARLALVESGQQVRALAAQNELAREAERKHIAREVHDELGQILTALRMELTLMSMNFSAQVPALVEHVVGAKGLLDQALQAVRNVAKNLRPPMLDLGFVPGIAWLCRSFTERTGVACRLHGQDLDVVLEESRAVMLFRIVQESLTNITRYANADQVDITLTRQDAELRIEVRDNGRGFDMDAVAHTLSFGLIGMRERALALNGQLHIASAPGLGVVVRVRIPIEAPPARGQA